MNDVLHSLAMLYLHRNLIEGLNLILNYLMISKFSNLASKLDGLTVGQTQDSFATKIASVYQVFTSVIDFHIM